MYSEQELLNWLWELGDGKAHPPSQADLRDADGPSRSPYIDRFGSWSRAKQLALGYSESE